MDIKLEMVLMVISRDWTQWDFLYIDIINCKEHRENIMKKII
jgi:hypothetical protein